MWVIVKRPVFYLYIVEFDAFDRCKFFLRGRIRYGSPVETTSIGYFWSISSGVNPNKLAISRLKILPKIGFPTSNQSVSFSFFTGTYPIFRLSLILFFYILSII